MSKIAVVFGSSGLIGSALVNQLLENELYSQIILPVRKINHAWNETKVKQHEIRFDALESYEDILKGDVFFLCLGTTMAKAKSKEAFYKVDFTYTYQAALLAAKNPNAHVLLISSMGADASSWVYYSKVKGEIENAIQELPDIKVSIFRPSLLLGERKESRFGEKIAMRVSEWFFWIFMGPLAKYKPIHATDVAKFMMFIEDASHPERCKIFSSDKMQP